MEKVRVSELLPGDRFQMGNVSYEVVGIQDGMVCFQILGVNYKGHPLKDGYMQGMGARSQKFVHLISRVYEKVAKKMVRQEVGALGSGPYQEHYCVGGNVCYGFSRIPMPCFQSWAWGSDHGGGRRGRMWGRHPG